MTDMRLVRLRVELYFCAQRLKGEDAEYFWKLLEEVLSIKEAMTATTPKASDAKT